MFAVLLRDHLLLLEIAVMIAYAASVLSSNALGGWRAGQVFCKVFCKRHRRQLTYLPPNHATESRLSDDPKRLCPHPAACHCRDQRRAHAGAAARHRRVLVDLWRRIAVDRATAHSAQTGRPRRRRGHQCLSVPDRHDAAVRTRARAGCLRLAIVSGGSRSKGLSFEAISAGLSCRDRRDDLHVQRCHRSRTDPRHPGCRAEGKNLSAAVPVRVAP